MIPYEPPKYSSDAFNCPHCRAFASQAWAGVSGYGNLGELDGLEVSMCSHCREYALWHHEKLIFPDVVGVQPPNEDLNEDLKGIYNEAASILSKSPKGAAALMRLAMQKLCVQLGEKGKNLNTDIGNLVKKGLPVRIQQALDIVRVVGNNTVHPGQMDLEDTPEIANVLFELVNLIAEDRITSVKKVNELFGTLPDGSRKQIEERDGNG